MERNALSLLNPSNQNLKEQSISKRNVSQTTIDLNSVQTPKKPKFKSTRKWTPSENQIYLKFIFEHRNQLENELFRRQTRPFKKLSNLMNGQKTSEQCRGHHKKYMENYKSIDKIAEALKKKLIRQELMESKEQMPIDKNAEIKSEKNNTIIEIEDISNFFEESQSKPYLEWVRCLNFE